MAGAAIGGAGGAGVAAATGGSVEKGAAVGGARVETAAAALLDGRARRVAAGRGHEGRVADELRAVGVLLDERQEAADVRVVERRIDFVEHADRGGIGEEQAEDQCDGGQRLFAAGQQGERLEPLAGRLGHDLQPGLERIVRIDQGQLGRAAAEQHGEEREQAEAARQHMPAHDRGEPVKDDGLSHV